MRRSIVCDPEDAPGRPIRFLTHDKINELVKRFDPGGACTETEHLGSPHVPSCYIRQSTFPLVFSFDSSSATWSGRCSWSDPFSCLNAGFFISTDDVIARAQEISFPYSLIQVQYRCRLFGKVSSSRKNPTAMTPGSDSILAEPPPDRHRANRTDNTAGNHFTGNVGMT